MKEAGVSFPGPDGQDALKVTKRTPQEVRAGEPFEYEVTVRNVSDSPVVEVVVFESVDGLEVRNAERQGQDRQGGNGQNQSQSGQSQSGQGQGGQNQDGQDQSGRRQLDRARDTARGQRGGEGQAAGSGSDGSGQDQKGSGQGEHGKRRGRIVQEGDRIPYEIGKLDAGESRTLTVSAVAREPGDAEACLWVDYEPTLCTTVSVVQPDFRLVGRLLFVRDVTTEGQVDGIYRCDDLTLAVEITSTGDASTRPGRMTVDLPPGFTAEDGQEQIETEFDRIQPDGSIRRRFPLKVDPRVAAGELRLPVRAEAGELQAEIELSAVQVLDPQLRVGVDAPKEAYIGQPVEMTVTVENTSNAPALNTTLDIQPPNGVDQFTVEGQGSGGGTIDIGRLNGGESREDTVRMQASRPSEVTVRAVAEAYCVTADGAEGETPPQDEAQIALRGIPAVLVVLVDKKDPVPVGEETVYEISVKNQGTDRDTEVEVTAELPDSMTFVRGDGDTEVTADGNRIEFGAVDELAPGDIASWTVTAKAEQPDRARLTVEMTSGANEEPITSQEPTTLYGDDPQADRAARQGRGQGQRQQGSAQQASGRQGQAGQNRNGRGQSGDRQAGQAQDRQNRNGQSQDGQRQGQDGQERPSARKAAAAESAASGAGDQGGEEPQE